MKIYAFVGVYDGLVDIVKLYNNEENAISAWEDYTECDWQKYKDSDYDDENINYKLSGSSIHETFFEDAQNSKILINDKDEFMCCLHDTPRNFDWCENNCEKYYNCDNILWADDECKIKHSEHYGGI